MPKRRTDAGVLVKTTIEVPEDLWKEVKILAIEEGTTLAKLIELALREFLKAKKRPVAETTSAVERPVEEKHR
jgi:predicted transcriptional regulator